MKNIKTILVVEGQENYTLNFTGNLTLANVDTYAEELKGIPKDGNINVNIENVEAFDLSFLQLFHSLKKTFSNISFRIDMGDDFINLLNKCGLEI